MNQPPTHGQRLPPLRALQAFEAVARSGSVTAAAAELGVSAGAISQQLRKLEEQLGLRLLERRGKGIELSTWGRLYQQQISLGFDQLRKAQQVLWRHRTQKELVVSCLSSVASKWLGPQLFDWQRSFPTARLLLEGAESEPDLQAGDIDFRISYGELGRRHENHVELFTDYVVPACAPALLKRRPVRSPADLLALPLIGIAWNASHQPPPGWADWAASVGAGTRQVPDSLAFSLSGAAIDAALAGRGIVLAQWAMMANDIASGRLVVPIDHRLPLPQPYFLAWDRAALSKPFGAEFRNWMRAAGRRQARLSAGAAPLTVAADLARARQPRRRKPLAD